MLNKPSFLGSQEFLAVLENGMIDLPHVVRKVARLQTEDDRQDAFGTAILVGRYLQHLKDQHQHTAETRKRIERVLRRFCLIFGELDPCFINAELISYWIRHQEWSSSTQDWVALLLERVYQFGVDEQLLGCSRDGLRSHVWQNRRGAHQ